MRGKLLLLTLPFLTFPLLTLPFPTLPSLTLPSFSRDRLYSIYRTLAPEAVDRRKRHMDRRRGEYIVPGPNFIWSVDGYLKLEPYGIEIYAGIDAYARYIVWIYVGVSCRTAVSVLRQFLDVLDVTEQQPRFIRSDRGNETVLMASAHHQLLSTLDNELQFQDCYIYGTSTNNERIESWWGRLSRGMLQIWRVSYPCFYFYLANLSLLGLLPRSSKIRPFFEGFTGRSNCITGNLHPTPSYQDSAFCTQLECPLHPETASPT